MHNRGLSSSSFWCPQRKWHNRLTFKIYIFEGKSHNKLTSDIYILEGKSHNRLTSDILSLKENQITNIDFQHPWRKSHSNLTFILFWHAQSCIKLKLCCCPGFHETAGHVIGRTDFTGSRAGVAVPCHRRNYPQYGSQYAPCKVKTMMHYNLNVSWKVAWDLYHVTTWLC
jgi:hypothetical protein